MVVKPAVGAGSVGAQRFTDAEQARGHAQALQADGRTALVQPYDPRIEDGETALVFLGGGSPTRSPRGRCCRRPANCAALDESGTFAEETLRPADPDFELWDVGHAALAAAAARLDLGVDEFLYARVDVIGGPDDPRLLELELVEPSLGWRQLDETARGLQQREFALGVESALERFGLGPLTRIDAHSAAVAAVQMAAPATCTATSAAGTPVKNCTVPTMPCRATRTSSTTTRIVTGRGARTASSAKPRPTSRHR